MLAVAFVFVLTVLDPLGFDSVTKSQSAKLLYKIYGASYPKRTRDDRIIMRDDITVVLLDELTINKTFQDTWPPSNRVHGDVLRAILDFNPAAVLVDMVFLRAEPDVTPQNDDCNPNLYPSDFKFTASVVSKYNEKHIPIFMVSPSEEVGVGQGRFEINKLSSCHKITLVSAELEGEPGRPPLYPLHTDSSGHEPAALALYHAICPTDRSRPLNDSLSRIQREAISECADIREGNGSDKMEVVWALAPAEINCQRALKYGKLACEDVGRSGFLGRAAQLLWQGVTPEEYRLTDPFPVRYHAEIPTTELLNGDNHEEVKKWLAGKIVVYSSQTASAKDSVLSPIHGNVPGAFMHAMALDNLLTFGDKYAYRANEGLYNGHWTKFFPTLVMFLASMAVIRNRYYLLKIFSVPEEVEGIREADEHFLRRWITWPLIGAIIVFGFVLFFIFRIAPFNWLGLLVVIHVWHRVEKWFFNSVKDAAHAVGSA